MVLNFFQLRNYTDFTFELNNSENAGDNYTVAPYETTARGDMWLAQGNGSKGVTILTNSDGAATHTLLHMWDEDWAIRYRIGGQADVQAIAVDGNKDFSIDVHDLDFTFICYNGSFTSGTSEVKVTEWKDQITTSFSETVSDPSTVEYPLDYASSEASIELPVDDELRSSRVGNINTPTAKQRQQITDLVAMWIDDYLDAGRRQGTLYADGNGWRIDLQDNGSVVRRGMHYYNIAVQWKRVEQCVRTCAATGWVSTWSQKNPQCTSAEHVPRRSSQRYPP